MTRTMWENMRDGATHFGRRALPPPRHPVRQFFHGLCLPFHLARALLSEPAARRRYVRVGVVQAVVILALGLTCTRSADEAVEAAKERAERGDPASAPRLGVEVRIEPREAAGEAHAPAGVVEAPEAGEIAQKPRRVKGLVVYDLEFWAALFAALQLVQWVVIALSRDFHDAISRDASLLTAIEPEDEPLTPRIRLDVGWVRKKLSRRLRALVVFLAGLPALFLLTALLPRTNSLLTVLIPAWSAYWLVVFTAAKSARAWEDEAARAPWFLRAWTWLTTRVPGFRWGWLQRYGLFWGNRTRSVFSPAAEVERQPWAFAGLGLVRALAMLPLLKCFLRPLIPVAAAHLLAAQRAAAAPPSEAPAPPADPLATSSATAA